MPDLASSLATPPAALPPPSGTETVHKRQDPLNREPGPLRNGNKRGNPALAPRCGAKNRAGGACQAPALRGHTRCRLHGGASTGPRTAAGLARLAAARTSHGRESEAMRAEFRHRRVTLGRMRVLRAAVGLKAWLPEEQRERLALGCFGVPELRMPAHPGLAREAAAGPEDGRRDAQGRFVKRAKGTRRGVAGERAAARAERAALAPWRAAIAVARGTRRAAWEERREKSRQDPMDRGDGVGLACVATGEVVGGPDEPGHDVEGRGGLEIRNSRQEPMNRGDGGAWADGAEAGARSPRPCGPRDDTAGEDVGVAGVNEPHAPVAACGPEGTRIGLAADIRVHPCASVVSLAAVEPADCRQDPMNREPGRGWGGNMAATAPASPPPPTPLPQGEGDKPHAPVLAPPPGLTRKQRKRWKWVQRQARTARGGDVAGSGARPNR